jgi:hypothetical protein
MKKIILLLVLYFQFNTKSDYVRVNALTTFVDHLNVGVENLGIENLLFTRYIWFSSLKSINGLPAQFISVVPQNITTLMKIQWFLYVGVYYTVFNSVHGTH